MLIRLHKCRQVVVPKVTEEPWVTSKHLNVSLTTINVSVHEYIFRSMACMAGS